MVILAFLQNHWPAMPLCPAMASVYVPWSPCVLWWPWWPAVIRDGIQQPPVEMLCWQLPPPPWAAARSSWEAHLVTRRSGLAGHGAGGSFLSCQNFSCSLYFGEVSVSFTNSAACPDSPKGQPYSGVLQALHCQLGMGMSCAALCCADSPACRFQCHNMRRT